LTCESFRTDILFLYVSRWIRYICGNEDQQFPVDSCLSLKSKRYGQGGSQFQLFVAEKQNMFGEIWQGIDPNEEENQIC